MNLDWDRYWRGKATADGLAGAAFNGVIATWWCDRYGETIIDRHDRAYCPKCGFNLYNFHDRSRLDDLLATRAALAKATP